MSAEQRVNINFLFLGPDKAGSTWMYKILSMHPDVFVPKCKDIYFFDRYFHRGYGWYQKHFSGAGLCKAVGELSHDYLFSADAAKRIKSLLPEVKLIICIRDPVERSISHYLQIRKSGLTKVGLRESLEKFPEIVENSRYSKYVVMYENVFGPGCLNVLFFDELKREPEKFARRLFEVIGVEFLEDLPYSDVVGEAGMARWPLMSKFGKYIANMLRDLRLENVLGRLKYHPVVRGLFYKPLSRKELPGVCTEDVKFLEEQLSGELARLEGVLRINLKNLNSRS